MAYEDWDILEKEYWQLNEIVKRLKDTAKARAVVLIEKSGQLVTSAGDTKRMDMVSLAALVAADFAASNEISLMLGEEGITELVHEGNTEGVFLTLVAGQFILIVVYSNADTKLGLVRIRAKVASKELSAVFIDIVNRIKNTYVKTEESQKNDSMSELDDIF